MATVTKEIFAVGIWNGMDFSIEDLKLISAAFHTLGDKHQVPLKMGHNDEQPLTDGQPALGWVTDVYVENEKLIGEFSDVPDIVAETFENKLYRNVSVELDFGVEYKGSYFPTVLSGVALLGADIPAVNTLDDLKAYMGKSYESKTGKHAKFSSVKNNAKFSAIFGKKTGVKDMADSEEVKLLKAQLIAKDAELEKMVNKVTTLEQERIENKAKFAAVEAAEKARKQSEQRKLLSDKLELLVTDKKIAPFTRDDFLNDYDQADDNMKATIVFSVDKMEKTIDANPAYFGAEQARNKAKKDKLEEGMTADKIVAQRTKEYMAKHGEKSFSVAKTMVLSADAELANKYTKQEA